MDSLGAFLLGPGEYAALDHARGAAMARASQDGWVPHTLSLAGADLHALAQSLGAVRDARARRRAETVDPHLLSLSRSAVDACQAVPRDVEGSAPDPGSLVREAAEYRLGNYLDRCLAAARAACGDAGSQPPWRRRDGMPGVVLGPPLTPRQAGELLGVLLPGDTVYRGAEGYEVVGLAGGRAHSWAVRVLQTHTSPVVQSVAVPAGSGGQPNGRLARFVARTVHGGVMVVSGEGGTWAVGEAGGAPPCRPAATQHADAVSACCLRTGSPRGKVLEFLEALGRPQADAGALLRDLDPPAAPAARVLQVQGCDMPSGVWAAVLCRRDGSPALELYAPGAAHPSVHTLPEWAAGCPAENLRVAAAEGHVLVYPSSGTQRPSAVLVCLPGPSLPSHAFNVDLLAPGLTEPGDTAFRVTAVSLGPGSIILGTQYSRGGLARSVISHVPLHLFQGGGACSSYAGPPPARPAQPVHPSHHIGRCICAVCCSPAQIHFCLEGDSAVYSVPLPSIAAAGAGGASGGGAPASDGAAADCAGIVDSEDIACSQTPVGDIAAVLCVQLPALSPLPAGPCAVVLPSPSSSAASPVSLHRVSPPLNTAEMASLEWAPPPRLSPAFTFPCPAQGVRPRLLSASPSGSTVAVLWGEALLALYRLSASSYRAEYLSLRPQLCPAPGPAALAGLGDHASRVLAAGWDGDRRLLLHCTYGLVSVERG